MRDLKKFDIKFQNKKMPIYKKRYKKNGEQYLKKVDEIDIQEDMKEKRLEISRIKEIYNIQDRLKAEELLDNLTNEDFLEELKQFENYSKDMDMFEFLNMTAQVQEIYNKMPQETRLKYKDLSKFTKEFIPDFIAKQSIKLNTEKQAKEELQKTNVINQTQEEIQTKIEELQKQLKGNENV